MISQLTIFLENEKGRLAAATRTIADAGVNMKALNIAESTEYGVMRVICDTPEKAAEALNEAGFRASVTKVMAVQVPDVCGGLADLLEQFDKLDINIEYGYCFATADDTVIDILKVKDPSVEVHVKAAGIKVLAPEDVYGA